MHTDAPTPQPAAPAVRLALLDTMLRLRAVAGGARGDEAEVAGLAAALALLGPQRRGLLQVQRGSPWTLRPADVLAVDAHDVEAVHLAALRLAQAIVADGRSRRLALVTAAPALGLSDDGADAEEHAAWQPVDPIALHTRQLLLDGVVSPGELLHLHQRAMAEAGQLQRQPAPVLVA